MDLSQNSKRNVNSNNNNKEFFHFCSKALHKILFVKRKSRKSHDKAFTEESRYVN